MEFQTQGISATDSMAMVLTLWFANSSFGRYQQSHFYTGLVMHGSYRLRSVSLPGGPGLNPMPFNLGFVVDRVELGQSFSGYFGFPRRYHCPPVSRTRSLVYDRSCTITADSVVI